MSVYIIRAFVRLREFAPTNEKLAKKVAQLENRVSKHDEVLTAIIREIKQLIDSPKPKGTQRRIGFVPPK